MRIRIIFLGLVLCLSLSTQVKAQNDSCLTKGMAVAYGINDSLLQIWRSDKYGCSKRRIGIVDSLFKLEQLMNIPKKAFLILYGNPDKYQQGGTLVYRNVMHCDKNKNAEIETNSLDIAIFFKNDHLIYFEKIFVD